MQICQFEQINGPVIDVVPRLMPCAEGRRPRGLQGVIELIARLQVQQTRDSGDLIKTPPPLPAPPPPPPPPATSVFTRRAIPVIRLRCVPPVTARWRVDAAAGGRRLTEAQYNKGG